MRGRPLGPASCYRRSRDSAIGDLPFADRRLRRRCGRLVRGDTAEGPPAGQRLPGRRGTIAAEEGRSFVRHGASCPNANRRRRMMELFGHAAQSRRSADDPGAARCRPRKQAEVLVPNREPTASMRRWLAQARPPSFASSPRSAPAVDHIDLAYGAPSGGNHRDQYPGRPHRGHRRTWTMALILAVSRRLSEGRAAWCADGKWQGWGPTFMLGHRIWGKRLGIIGMGRIGQGGGGARAKGFGPLRSTITTAAAVPFRRPSKSSRRPYWESLDQMPGAYGRRSRSTLPAHAGEPIILLSRRAALRLLAPPRDHRQQRRRGEGHRREHPDPPWLAAQRDRRAPGPRRPSSHEPAVNPKLLRARQTSCLPAA